MVQVGQSGSLTVSSQGTSVGVALVNGGEFDNSGVVAVSGVASAHGVDLDNGYAGGYTTPYPLFTNSGAITATAATSVGVEFSGLMWIQYSSPGANYNIVNTGNISAQTAIDVETPQSSPTAQFSVGIDNGGTLNGDVNVHDNYVNFLNTGTINGNLVFGDGNSTINSSQGTINGSITVGAGSNTIITGANDDGIYVGGGSNAIDGGGGYNILDLANFDKYKVSFSNNGDGSWTLDLGGVQDIIRNIQLVRFSNGQVFLTPDSIDLSGNPNDTVSPTLTSLTLPSSVDVTHGSGTATFSAGASDFGTDVDHVVINLTSAIQTTSGAVTSLDLSTVTNSAESSSSGSSGTMSTYADSFSAGETLTNANTSGAYDIASVDVYNKAGADTTYTDSQLQTLGLATSIYIDGGYTESYSAGGQPYTSYSQSYTAGGQLFSETLSGYDPSVYGYASVTDAFDSLGRVTGQTYSDAAGHTVESLALLYNNDGSSSETVTGVSGQGYTSYSQDFDSSDHLTSETLAGYDPNVYGYASVTDTFDPQGRITAQSYDDASGNVVQSIALTYGGDGSATETVTGVSGQGYTSYSQSFDPSGHLVSETLSGYTTGAFASVTDTFDTQGRIVGQIYDDAQGHVVQSLTASYNADGSSTVTYSNISGQAFNGYSQTFDSHDSLVFERIFNVDGSETDDAFANGQTFSSVTTGQFQNAIGTDETFVIQPGFTQITINGYQPGQDSFDISHTLFSDFDELIAAASSDGAGDTVITYDHSQFVILGMTPSQLQQHASDFHFT